MDNDGNKVSKRPRREVRNNAFVILFEGSFRDETPEELYAIAEEFARDFITVDSGVRELVDGVYAHKPQLDKIIARYSPTREFSRISKINLTALRLALFEIMYDDDTPNGAAISEALINVENYSYDIEDKQFVNGVLAAFVNSC